jgi:DNA sulfur modification protein DndB
MAPAGRDRIYSLFVPARILLDIAYVLRIESGQKKAYQRFLDKNRLFKVAKFLEDGKSFKNSIVLALDPHSRFTAKRTRWGNVGTYGARIGLLKIPRQYASAWVIDGQHRLYGFARAEKDLLGSLLSVIALESRSRTEEAETFVDINKNQKPVDPNLLWVLFGQLYPHETRGVISDLVRELATNGRSVLRNKIYIPGESKHPRREYHIFHSNLCETIGDHLVEGRKSGFPLISSEKLFDPKRSEVLNHACSIISEYISLICDIAETARVKHWARDFFLTNNGLNVMIRVLVQVLKYSDGKLDKGEIRGTFGHALSDYLMSREPDIAQLRRQTSSEGTREFAAYGFIRALARGTEGFAEPYLRERQKDRENQEPYKLMRKIEDSLRECIHDSLAALSENWWRERIPPDVRDLAQERKERDESPWPWMDGKQYPAYYYMNFSEYSKVISKRDNWREAFEATFVDAEWVRVWFKDIERIRNDIAHNRDLTERQLNLLRFFSDDLARVLAGAKTKLGVPAALEVGAPLPIGA